VKQLIARIDDDLHARIEAQAADEGRTVNEVVVGALERATLDRLDVVRPAAVDAGAGRAAEPDPQRRPTGRCRRSTSWRSATAGAEPP